MTRLPTPETGRRPAELFVADHLGHLVCDRPESRSEFVGGQVAADAALQAFDVAGYASKRNQVRPVTARGASRLSPYIRHGLLSLPAVWDYVAGGPERDVAKFRDELLWQEYARHLYARLGTRTASPLRYRPAERPSNPMAGEEPGTDERGSDADWESRLPCVSSNVDELTEHGWLVNQSRMWLSSHWTVRHQRPWVDGEDFFFRHLLDGSRAANRLGWQWTTGAGSAKTYGFSRWQVNKRARELCRSCPLSDRCPIEAKPTEGPRTGVSRPELLSTDHRPEVTGGPSVITVLSPDADDPARTVDEDPAVVGADPAVVWLTAESLGVDDPALARHGDATAVFVFDERLLARLRLSSKRLVFLAETLAELAASRPLELYLGDPVEVLAGRRAAVTFAPVPGFRSRLARLVQSTPVEVHPWPWLVRPHGRSIQSFTAWRKATGR